MVRPKLILNLKRLPSKDKEDDLNFKNNFGLTKIKFKILVYNLKNIYFINFFRNFLSSSKKFKFLDYDTL